MSWQRLSMGDTKSEHTCLKLGEKGCQGCRWFSVKIDADDNDQFRVTSVGHSTVPGEIDRVRVELTFSAAVIIDVLTIGPAGERYIPRVSRKAILEAAEEYPELAAALAEADAVAARS